MADYTLGFTGAQIDAALAFANNGAMKAFGVFNGATTDKSYNVTSITDSSTGRFVLNFTNDFADANYLVPSVGGAQPTNSRGGDFVGFYVAGGAGRATGLCPVAATAASSASSIAVAIDRPYAGAGIVGDLA